MKGQACRSKPGTHMMTRYSYSTQDTQHGHTHLCSTGKDEKYSNNSFFKKKVYFIGNAQTQYHQSIYLIHSTVTSSLKVMIDILTRELFDHVILCNQLLILKIQSCEIKAAGLN